MEYKFKAWVKPVIEILDEQFFNDIDGAERLLLLERKMENEMFC